MTEPITIKTKDATDVWHDASGSDLSHQWRHNTAAQDIPAGLRAVHVWGTLGWHDIRQRYRRSVIGPFWFTINTALMVAFLGALYATLLKQPIREYLPFLAAGLVIWQYISTVALESCSVFIGAGYIIKQIKLPLTIHVGRLVWRNFIILLHSLPILILLLVFLGHPSLMSLLLIPAGLVLLLLNGIWVGIVLGILCTRFRDIPPVVANLVQIAFFFTPVMWTPEILKAHGRGWVAEFNPFYHLIEILRAPLLGKQPQLISWVSSISIVICGFLFAQWLMSRYRGRVAYWL